MNYIRPHFILIYLTSILFSQESISGRPYSFDNLGLRAGVETFVADNINVTELLEEDANQTIPAPYRYGYRYSTNIDMNTHGTWEILDNGDAIWRLTIQSHNAYGMKVLFDSFWLPEKAELYVFSKNHAASREN